MIAIEVLTVPECPHAEQAMREVQELLADERIDAEISRVLVPDEATAKRMNFAGSPTIRVNGRDVEPDGGAVGFACRVYRDGAALRGTPPASAIRAALRRTREGADSDA